MIAVTGASGGIGRRVVAALAGTHPLRLVVRDPARAPDAPGAEVAVATYGDPAAMRAALAGADTVFLVSGSEARDRVEQHRTAVRAAWAAGAGAIVYLSFQNAGPEATFTFARDHFHTEEAIRATGIPFTFLRDNLYADFLPGMCGTDGVIRGPAGDGRAAWVARDDVAAVAAAVLRDPAAHAGATYDVTGPEAIDMVEAAEQLAEVTGREIRYEEETLAQARASRQSYGAPDWEVEGWVTTYAAIAAGELERVSDTVTRLTGRPARSFADVLTERPRVYRHLLR
jgi:NAD(P)H dehydrogenase (quinone)